MAAIIAGAVLMIATALLLHTVMPRAGRTRSAWLQRGVVSSSLALLIVIGFITGIALIASGFASLT